MITKVESTKNDQIIPRMPRLFRLNKEAEVYKKDKNGQWVKRGELSLEVAAHRNHIN